MRIPCSRVGLAVAVVLLVPSAASASWFTHIRDAVTAPVRVPAQAVIHVVQKPTLQNVTAVVISPGKAVKETADNVLGAANDAVEGHPDVQKALDGKQIGVSVPVGGPGGGSTPAGGSVPSGGSAPSGGSTAPRPSGGASPGTTVTATIPVGGSGATVVVGQTTTGPQGAPRPIGDPPPAGGPQPSSPAPAPPVAFDDGDYDPAVEPARAPAATPSPAAQRIKDAADKGYAAHPDLCNQSVIHALGILGNHDLDGKDANAQVDFMQKHWKTITGEQAKALADAGTIVIAGLDDTRIDPTTKKAHSGHVMMVVPGLGAKRRDSTTNQDVFYPNVEGGGADPQGRSDGRLTSANTWRPSRRASVKYFTP